MPPLRHVIVHILFWFVISLSSISRVSAQLYPVRLYTNADGLSQIQVMSVFADSRGLLWAGTKFGVSRFNGERFEQLPPSLLKGNTFSHITEDRNGRLWFTTGYGRGSARYDGRTVRFFSGLTSAIHFDHQNRGWTTDTNGRLRLFWQDSLYHTDRLLPSLRNERIMDMFYHESSQQLILITRSNRVFLYHQNRLVPLSVPYRFDLDVALNGQWGPHLIADHHHWIVKSCKPGQRRALTYLYFDGHQFIPFVDYVLAEKRFTWLRPLPCDYFIAIDGKIYRIDRQTTRLQPVTEATSGAHTFAQIGTSQFIGTEQGLCKLNDTGFRHFDRHDAPYVWSVAEDRNGLIWWLNYRSPIGLWDGQTVRAGPNFKLSRDDEWYFGSRRGADNALYLSHLQGIVRYDGKQHRLLHPTNPKQPAHTWSTLEDTRRNWWVQGSEGRLNVYQQGRYVRSFCPEQGLPDFIDYHALTQDSYGNYWTGGTGGFCRFNPNTGQVNAYTTHNKRFIGGTVYGLGFDSTQTLWIASSGGLAYLEAKTESVRFVGQTLFQTPISYFGIKGRYLFAGDLRALYVLDLAHFHRTGQLRIKGFNEHNGFMGVEPGQNGFFCDSKDRVWIPSGSVLSYLDLKHLTLTSDPLRANIYAVNDSLLPVRHRPDSVLNLPYGQDIAKITYEAIGFDRAARTQYRYRLNNDPWSDWLTAAEVYLTNLVPGNHRFELEARRNSHTGEPPALTSVRFRTHLPFWKWAIFPYLAILLFGTGAGSVGYLSYRSRRNSLRLQEQDHQLLFLQVQTLQAQLNPHFIFNVLGSVQRSILNDDREQANQSLVRLSQLIRGFLESSVRGNDLTGKSRSDDFEVRLDKEIEMLRAYVEFECLQYRNQFSYAFDWPATFDPSLWSLPPMLIQPFVENAIKHGLLGLPANTPGHLWVRFRPDADDSLMVEIGDSGIGRDEARQQQARTIRPHASHGGRLVEQRIAVLNRVGYRITLTTTDRSPGGTVVRLHINSA